MPVTRTGSAEHSEAAILSLAVEFQLRKPRIGIPGYPARGADPARFPRSIRLVWLGLAVVGCVGSCNSRREPGEGQAQEPGAAPQAELASESAPHIEGPATSLPRSAAIGAASSAASGVASGAREATAARSADPLGPFGFQSLAYRYCTPLDAVFKYPGGGPLAPEFTARLLEVSPGPPCDAATPGRPARLGLELVRSAEPGCVDFVALVRATKWKEVLCTAGQGAPYGFAGKQVDQATLGYECVLPSGTKEGVLQIHDGAITHRFWWGGSGSALAFTQVKPSRTPVPYGGPLPRFDTESWRITCGASVTISASTAAGVAWSGGPGSSH